MRFIIALATFAVAKQQLLNREGAKDIDELPARPFERVAAKALGGVQDDEDFEAQMTKQQRAKYINEMAAMNSMAQTGKARIPPPPGAVAVGANGAPQWAKELHTPPKWASQIMASRDLQEETGHAGDAAGEQQAQNDKGDLALINDAVDARMAVYKGQMDDKENKIIDEVENLGAKTNADIAKATVKMDATSGTIAASQTKLGADLSADAQATADLIAKEASDVHVLQTEVDHANEGSELARSMAIGEHSQMLKRDERITRLETLVQTNEHRIEAAMDALNSRITELAKETFTETDAIRKEASNRRNSEFSKTMSKFSGSSNLQLKSSNAAAVGLVGLVAAMLM
jgi:hypothetical protein